MASRISRTLPVQAGKNPATPLSFVPLERADPTALHQIREGDQLLTPTAEGCRDTDKH